MTDLLDHDAADLSALLAAGKVSAQEVMEATLSQIDQVNPAVNAVVSLRDADELMAEARAADGAARKGWLHGIPLAVKDLANVAGLPTTRGSTLFAGQAAPKDDLVVARMRAAGAIIIGKTNTPEYGLGSHTFNPVFGATRNPWDLGRSAGGSSGGAAVALATRMLCVADGSDMMGSLRNPAGWANVYGMRPTWGLVPSEAEGDTFLHQLSTLGPMARTPRDLGALLATQSGPDPRQPHGLPAFVPAPLDCDLTARRIGWLGDWGGAFTMEAGLLDDGAAALSRFRDMGCTVEEVAPPFSAAALWDSWTTLRSWTVAAGLGALLDQGYGRKDLKPEALWEIDRGRALSAMDVHRASVIRSQWFTAAAALLNNYDALVLPAAQVRPFPVEWRWPQTIAGTTMDTYHRWMEIVVPVSLIGLPCVCLPAGFGAQGLPHGLQLFGRRGSDQTLLEISQGWETARTAEDRQGPPVSARPA